MAAMMRLKTPINTVIGYRFSVKKTRIISRLKLKLVASEIELGTNCVLKAQVKACGYKK